MKVSCSSLGLGVCFLLVFAACAGGTHVMSPGKKATSNAAPKTSNLPNASAGPYSKRPQNSAS